MPRDGSGTYSRPLGTTPVDGDTILAANYNSAIDDIATALTASVPRDGSAAMTGALVLPGDPSTALQAATKQYVDGAVSSLASGAFKAPVRAATTANITLSGTQTIDGIALVADDRVLVKNQTTASGNGIYLVKVGAWVRATDFDAWSEIFGTSVIVDQGSTQADTVWICTANAGGTLGSTSITFAQMQGQIADGTLALARLVNAGGASRLIGRGSAGGAGAWQEITLGAGLSMASQVLSATASGIIDYQAFPSAGAGTWTKPAGATVNDLVLVTMWAAGGGGGATNGGGGGGGFALLLIPAISLGATVSISIGAGGAVGAAGGNTSFGPFTVFGGGAGAAGGGGGGGGALSAGIGGGSSGGGPAGGATGTPGGDSSFGGGGGGTNVAGSIGGNSAFGGGGGGRTAAGGNSFFAGGGGGNTGGTSVLAGSGGGTGVAGAQPGGGGGINAAGAAGLMRVWTFRVG
ncbi:MAG: hypothetical protein ACK5X3_00380 [Pseudomonadota bacterium]